MKILLIEDEKKVARFIARGLKEQRFTVDVAHNATDGEYLFGSSSYDLVILDLMLPDKDGIEVCRAIRRRKSNLPVLMLTARDTLESKVAGLDAGADDYLVKPFAFEELLARVRALTRRGATQQQSTELAAGKIRLNLLTHQCLKDKKPVSLTAMEYKVLEFFMRNVGRVITRTELYEKIWGFDFDTDTNLVDVYVNHLKKKLDEGTVSYFKTQRGSGYVFQPPAR